MGSALRADAHILGLVNFRLVGVPVDGLAGEFDAVNVRNTVRDEVCDVRTS